MSQPVLECEHAWDEYCGCTSAPCWPRPDTNCCDRLRPTDPTPEQTALIERMLKVSVEIMHNLSGRQFGACPVTVRPCRTSCGGSQSYGYWSGNLWTPVLDGGTWYNERTCGQPACKSACSCAELCEVDLPGPVAEVLSVTVDGTPLDLRDYRVDNARKLVRTGRHFTNTGPFVVDVVPEPDNVGEGEAHLGSLKLSRFNHVVGNFMSVIFPANTMHVEGLEGDFVTLLPGPGMTITYPPSWTVSNLGTGLTNPVAGVIVAADAPPAIGNVRLTISAAEPAGDIVGALTGTDTGQTGPFAAVAGSGQDVDWSACWPTCQDMAKPTSETGTFAVTYRRGNAVPQAGLWAAGLLACELLKACDPAAGECALPTNAQRIARQGVTVELTPVLVNAGSFATGIPEVDLWLTSVNPYKAKLPSRVFSVDRPQPRVTTWPC